MYKDIVQRHVQRHVQSMHLLVGKAFTFNGIDHSNGFSPFLLWRPDNFHLNLAFFRIISIAFHFHIQLSIHFFNIIPSLVIIRIIFCDNFSSSKQIVKVYIDFFGNLKWVVIIAKIQKSNLQVNCLSMQTLAIGCLAIPSSSGSFSINWKTSFNVLAFLCSFSSSHLSL